jgi:phosphoribosylformylglycinamidine (FGAM) synthase-like enzyme
MAFAGGIGAQVDLAKMPISQAEKSAGISAAGDVFDPYALAFAEDPSRYILEVKSSDAHALCARFAAAGIPSAIIGQTDSSSELRVCHGDIDLGFESLEKLRAAWSSGSSGW